MRRFLLTASAARPTYCPSMKPSLVACAFVTVSACASSPRVEPTAPPRVVAAVTAVDAAPAAEVDASAPASVVDPCHEGDAYEALASLMSNLVAVDSRVGGAPRPSVRPMDLSPLFPAVRRQGFEVLSVMPIMPMQGRAWLALVAPAGASIVRDRDVPGAALGVLACDPAAGWTLVAPPAPLGLEGVPQLRSHALLTLGDSRYAETVTVLTVAQTLESSTHAYVLGRGFDALPVRSPPGAAIGLLAELGPVGEQVVAEGTSEHRTVVPLDATGWYPFGAERVFLRVARDRRPGLGGRWTDRVLGASRARLGPHGFDVDQSEDGGAAWVLVGVGELPAWCTGRTDLRCVRLGVGVEGLPEGATPFTWLAGAWPIGSAVPREVQAPGARWLHLGPPEGPRLPRDPGGHSPLAFIDVRVAATAR